MNSSRGTPTLPPSPSADPGPDPWAAVFGARERAWLLAGAALVFAAGAAASLGDPDFGMHLRIGEWVAAHGRVPAVEVMLNSKLVSELIEKGDFSGVKEAMEKAMAEGSQTFEADIARLIIEGVVDKKEGLSYADSPTNLQWRLQNDFAAKDASQDAAEEDPDDTPSFTEITLDVKH